MIGDMECECGCGGFARRRFIHGHNKRSKRVVLTANDYRLEDRGYSSPCWISRWKSDHPRGYVRIRSENRRVGAHVLMWVQVHGSLEAGLQLDHLCRQPPCINPDHLEPVSGRENTRRGSGKLIPEQVREIRRLRTRGWRQIDIAEAVGSTRGTVSNVLRGVHWKDVH